MSQTWDRSVGSAPSARKLELSPPLLECARNLLLPVLDAFCILLPPLCQAGLDKLPRHQGQYLVFWGILAVSTVILIQSYGGYRGWTRNRRRAAMIAVQVALLNTFGMLAIALLLGHDHVISSRWTVPELCAPALLMVFTRIAAAESVVAAPEQAGPLIICYNECPPGLARAMAAQGIGRPCGVLFLSGEPVVAPSGWTVFAGVPALLAAARARQVKDVVLAYQPAFEGLPDTLRKALLSDLLVLPVRIWFAFSLAAELPHPLLKCAGSCRLVPVTNDRLVNSLNLAKRGFDIVFGTLLLALAMPLLGGIALAVRLDGSGPIVFRQNRIGAHGHRFDVLKFRTMRHRAGTAFTQARRVDKRVTRIGRFLRRTSLGELLQLVNVIRGDMSLVGPRPHAPETQVGGINFENAVQYYRLRHRVRPGMTGLAQIRGHRGETQRIETLEQRIASDLEYIDTWSIWLDVLILARTIPSVLGGRNAY